MNERPAYIFPNHYQVSERIETAMNNEITHAFGGIVGNGVNVCEKECVNRLSSRGRVTSICPRDIPDLITSGVAP